MNEDSPLKQNQTQQNEPIVLQQIQIENNENQEEPTPKQVLIAKVMLTVLCIIIVGIVIPIIIVYELKKGKIQRNYTNSPCQTYDNQGICKKCSIGYKNGFNNTCVQSCNSNQYSSDETCFDCDQSCSKCFGSGNNQCQQCANSYSLYQLKCICLGGYYQNTTTHQCEKCPENCQLCQNMSKCTKCNFMYKLTNQFTCNLTNDGNMQCQNGLYYDNLTNQCQFCNSICVTCSSTSYSCTSCKDGMNLSQNTCICPKENQFFNQTTQICTDCDTICLTCQNQKSNCLTCKPGMELINNYCQCKSQQYYDISDSKCQQCNLNCSECQITSANCTKCPNGYYLDSKSTTCLQCNSNCTTCQKSSTQCLSCPSNLMSLSDGKCICPDRYYSTGTKCQICDPHCLTCDGGNLNQCLKCDDKMNLNNNLCICNDGYYWDKDQKQCIQCYGNCNTCSGPHSSQCLSCRSDSNFISNSCICNDNLYYNVTRKTCSKCDESCQTCFGGAKNNCIKCNQSLNYTFHSNECISICDPHCKTCSGSSQQNCLSCREPQSKLQGNTCICSSGYYWNNNLKFCSNQCDSSCQSCNGPTNQNCTSCNKSINLILTENNSCTCSPENQYYDQKQNNCIACYGNCKTCYGSKPANCKSCYDRANLSKAGQCICLSQYYFNAKALQCQQCDPICASCNTSGICISCIDEMMIKINNTCQCQDGYYQTNYKCIPCQSTCLTCNGIDQCFTCVSGLAVSNGKCQCNNTQQYLDSKNSQCLSCDSSCLSCIGPSQDQCTGCSYGILSNKTSGKCICDEGTYFNINQCSNCYKTCKNCSDSDENSCIECYSNSTLQSDECVCPIGYYFNINQKTCSPCDQSCTKCSGSAFNCICDGYITYVSLQNVSSVFSANSQKIINLITNFNRIIGGQSGSQIQGGGNIIFQKGNLMSTNFQASIIYTNNTIISDSGVFGDQSSYFTNNYNGIFVLVADNNSASYFRVYSQYGNSNGNITTQSLTSGAYSAYVLQKYNNGKYGTVNQMIIFKTLKSNQTLKYSNSTQSGFIQVNGLQANKRIFYILYSTQNGYGLNQTQNQQILDYIVSFINTDRCTICDNSCLTCNGATENDCLSCNFSQYLIDKSNTCSDNCAQNQYDNNQVCYDCHYTCEECFGPSSLECLTCIQPLVRASYDECICNGAYKFYDRNQQTCLSCDEECLTCSGTLDTNCLSCDESLYLQQGQCVDECSTGYYEDEISSQCKQCDSQCQGCYGQATNCTSCKLSLAEVVGQKCQCKDGFYWDEKQLNCIACHPQCKSCFGSASNCTKCDSNLNLEKVGDECQCSKGKTWFNDEIQNIQKVFTQSIKNITNLIKSPANIITGGDIFNFIGGGGYQMFVKGNYLSTNDESNMLYTNSQILLNNYFGLNSQYFTQKFPYLFMLAAENVGSLWFNVYSIYRQQGALNQSFQFYTFNDEHYVGNFLQIYGKGYASVNEVIIYRSSGGINVNTNNSSTSGNFNISGLQNTMRIYYFLYSVQNGQQIDESGQKQIFQAIVTILGKMNICT